VVLSLSATCDFSVQQQSKYAVCKSMRRKPSHPQLSACALGMLNGGLPGLGLGRGTLAAHAERLKVMHTVMACGVLCAGVRCRGVGGAVVERRRRGNPRFAAGASRARASRPRAHLRRASVRPLGALPSPSLTRPYPESSHDDPLWWSLAGARSQPGATYRRHAKRSELKLCCQC
jgi:hypothetical protein